MAPTPHPPTIPPLSSPSAKEQAVAATPIAQTYTREQVRNHTSVESLWCIVDSVVYDLTDFLEAHPGGESVLRQVAGQDATEAFYSLHRHEVLTKYAHLAIGKITGEDPQVISPKPGDLSPVPYAEPIWLTPPFRSPYYSESHRRLQRATRAFTEEHIVPEAHECERTGRLLNADLIERMRELGILRMRLGPGKHLHGHQIMGGGVVEGKDFDWFHMLVLAQEMCRPLARGFQDGNMAGMTIGLTAILNFAPDGPWKTQITEEVFSGKTMLCLAISEAFAGSDVANIQTTAEKTPDGKHFVRSLYPPTCRQFSPFCCGT